MKKQRVVMAATEYHETWVEFEPESGLPNLAMSTNDYVDLGSPEEITVTIRPGDRLN